MSQKYFPKKKGSHSTSELTLPSCSGKLPEEECSKVSLFQELFSSSFGSQKPLSNCKMLLDEAGLVAKQLNPEGRNLVKALNSRTS